MYTNCTCSIKERVSDSLLAKAVSCAVSVVKANRVKANRVQGRAATNCQ